jgi:hypothetical protein
MLGALAGACVHQQHITAGARAQQGQVVRHEFSPARWSAVQNGDDHNRTQPPAWTPGPLVMTRIACPSLELMR